MIGDGLDAKRLAYSILSELQLQGFNVKGVGKDGVTWMNGFAIAISNAIVKEMKHAQLVPLVTDAGGAGRGIIAGTIR